MHFMRIPLKNRMLENMAFWGQKMGTPAIEIEVIFNILDKIIDFKKKGLIKLNKI